GYRGYGAAGALRADAMFASHAADAAAVGLPYGVYFYSQAVSPEEAVQEAEFVLELLRGYEICFPVAFDMEFLDASLEPRTLHLTKQERTVITRAFCERIAQAGYVPMIYGDARWFSEGVDAALLTEYDIWYAEYGEGDIPPDAAMVQYTNSGSLPGVKGTLDLNRCYRQFQNINQ
ncbi:MAG: Lyzozyme M1 (1,4-beta-N-acetylmuramidase), partial [Clostridia bacterium]|nr:Lyzozyme M1 (1,4-beta-N-acetylmuramidase) [Clostridia bacterium]